MKCFTRKKVSSSAHKGREVVHREIPTKPTEYETHGPSSRIIIIDQESLSADIKRFALKTTSAFEGRSLAGNFDGQGLSFGLLNWCVGQGSFQKNILGPAIERLGKDYVDSIFPLPMSPLLTMSAKQGVKYTLQMQIVKGFFRKTYSFKSDWAKAFEVFHELTKDIEQFNASEGLARKALKYCIEYNLTSVRAFCFFFDVVVQNGSMKGIHLSESERVNLDGLNMLVNDRDTMAINKQYWKDFLDKTEVLNDDYSFEAFREMSILSKLIIKRAAKNKWRADVISRKGTIIVGVGQVHGDFVEIDYNTFDMSKRRKKTEVSFRSYESSGA